MLIALLIAAAASSADIASLRALAAQDLRVAMIGDRLARAGGCRAVLSAPGWVVQDIGQYAPKLRPVARVALGLGEAPTVTAVPPGSAAARAGLRAGDEIEAVDGQPVAAATGSAKDYARVEQLEGRVEQGLKAGRIVVRFRRAGESRDATLLATPGCASRFQLLPGAKLNAVANGVYVQVSGALVEFAADDDELALVMAHELAHNILGHRSQLDAAGVSKGLFAGLGKNGQRIRDAEREADREALHLMARAGYDITIAPDFWRRFGKKNGPDFLRDGTHPGTAERVARARAEIALIHAQRAAGQPATP